jgi:hypothetical protein
MQEYVSLNEHVSTISYVILPHLRFAQSEQSGRCSVVLGGGEGLIIPVLIPAVLVTMDERNHSLSLEDPWILC